MFAVLAVVVLGRAGRCPACSSPSASDEEYAAGGRAAGARRSTSLLAVLAAVTVVVSMRVVGLLLVSALMIVPVAVAQRVGRSFRGTVATAMVVGVVVSVGGVGHLFYADTPSGATIVLLAIAVFVLTAAGYRAADPVRAAGATRPRTTCTPTDPACGHRAVAHEDHVDYLHDGHRHAPHGAHYDEHSPTRPRGPT